MKNNAPKLFFLLCLLLCLIVHYTCKKLEKEMLVSTGEVTNILTNSAEASGLVIDMGEGATQHGHCYATTPNVTIDGTKTQLDVPPGTGGFTSLLEGLDAGTKYYVKAYLVSERKRIIFNFFIKRYLFFVDRSCVNCTKIDILSHIPFLSWRSS